MSALRTIAVLGLALMLCACGFRPLYAIPGSAHGSMKAQLGSVYVEPISDRLGYELRNQIIDIIDGSSKPQGAAYHLRVTLAQESQAIGVQSQTVGTVTQTAITRYNDKLTVQYELVDAKTNTVLTRGIETGLSSYNVLSSPYATLVVRQDAEKRAADDIADRIRLDLAVFFAQKAKK